jgi:hypothetical protein
MQRAAFPTLTILIVVTLMLFTASAYACGGGTAQPGPTPPVAPLSGDISCNGP